MRSRGCQPEVVLRDWFKPTLPATFDLQAELFEIHGRGDFLSEEFLRCIRAKIDRIIESIHRHDNDLSVWSDIDILMFGDVPADLRRVADDEPEKVLWFQRERREGREVNTGFILIRCGREAAGFFEEVRERLTAAPDKNEQIVENEMLAGGSQIAWGLLPVNYVARTHGWPPQRDMMIYHANYTVGRDGIGQKIRQFREVTRIRRFGLPAVVWSSIKRAVDKMFFEKRRQADK